MDEEEMIKRLQDKLGTAVVPFRPKPPLAPTSNRDHIRGEEAEKMALNVRSIEYETPTIPVSRSAPKPSEKPLETFTKPVAKQREASWDYPLVTLAAGVFGVAMWINVQNAGGWQAILTNPLVALGLFMEGLLFFMVPRTLTLRGGRKVLAIGLCVFLFGYALTNSLRSASITSADQAQARTQQASTQLNTTCAGSGKTTTVKRGKTTTTTTTAEPAGCTFAKNNPAQAAPESMDFAKLIGLLSFGRFTVTEDAFGMLWLLLRTIAPQLGGLVLLLARR